MINSLFKRAAIFVLLPIVIGAFGSVKDSDFMGMFQDVPETLPGKSLLGMEQAADPDECQIIKKAIKIVVDHTRYPLTAKHVVDAKKAGEAKILHLDREGAEDNRDASLKGIPTKEGYDRDEYPPAASFEGGEGASVRYVPFSDNRGAGSSMGAQLGDYCSGQAFVIVTQR